MVDMRNLIEALVPGQGTLETGDFAVTPAPAGAGHAAVISPGRAFAQGAGFRQGSYFAWADEAETVPWPGPDALPRIDTLILQWYDPSMGTITRPAGPGWAIVPGQPATSPVARSDAAISATYAEPGAWLRVADVRIDPGQTSISGANITRRIASLTSRASRSRLKTSTSASSAFRNWAGSAPSQRRTFPSQYWDPVSVIVPHTGSVRATITGKSLNSSSPNAGVSFCYQTSGANSSSLAQYNDWEYLARGQLNQVSSTVQLLEGLNPGLTVFTPTLWTSETTTVSGIGITSGELVVEPVY